MSDHQRKMKVAETNEVSFDEVQIIETDETAWVRIGDTFIDVNRIQAVGLNEEKGLQVLLDSEWFITGGTDLSLEDAMALIVEATTEDDEDDK